MPYSLPEAPSICRPVNFLQRISRTIIDIVTLLVKAELAKTRNEGRRAVEQGGVSVDGEKITDPKYAVEKAAFGEDGIVLKKGKKNFKKICVK